MANPLDVAVIPAAGRGTRMRPATHAVPKAMLPIVDRPSVQYVVEEAVAAGARRVVLVVDPDGGDLISDHFDAIEFSPERPVRIETVVQEEPHGLGHAIACARPVIGDQPFMCLLADNVLRPGTDIMTPLLNAFKGASVVALNEVDSEGTNLYGIVAIGQEVSKSVVRLSGAVEKPGPSAAPSRLALIGRYIFSPEIFDVIGSLDPGHGGEVQLTDAVDQLARSGQCLGVITETDLLDTGRPIGMLEASAVMGIADRELRDDYLAVVDRERQQK